MEKLTPHHSMLTKHSKITENHNKTHFCAREKMKKEPKIRDGFYIVYAVLFILSIGLACTFYLNQSYHRSHTHSTLHGKMQLQLYARSLADMLTLCLKEQDAKICQKQEFSLPQGYHFRTTLTELNSQTFLLDIHGSIVQPSSNNTLRITKRYILFLP